MDRLTYLTHLRAAVTTAICGVQDASGSLLWDDTRPNYLTKMNLERLFGGAKAGAESFGVFVVNRHGPCGSKRHGEDYLLEPVAGEIVSYRDPRFISRGPIQQGVVSLACPCGGDRKRPHTVLVDVLFAVAADQAFCCALEDILTDLDAAIDKAGDRKPRSGIREHLLRALLVISDHIRPETLDDYIAKQTR